MSLPLTHGVTHSPTRMLFSMTVGAAAWSCKKQLQTQNNLTWNSVHILMATHSYVLCMFMFLLKFRERPVSAEAMCRSRCCRCSCALTCRLCFDTFVVSAESFIPSSCFDSCRTFLTCNESTSTHSFCTKALLFTSLTNTSVIYDQL